MIASARELGLGEDHDGIIVLSRLGLDPEVGTDAIALLGLDDEAVEINVTPDRGYAFSIRGVAREYAHATGAAFRDPASLVVVDDGHRRRVTRSRWPTTAGISARSAATALSPAASAASTPRGRPRRGWSAG